MATLNIPPTPAHAYSQLSNNAGLYNLEYNYRIDTASFGTNLTGLSLTASEAEYWVATALSPWIARTGIPLDFDYLGSTSASCQNQADAISSIQAANTTNSPALATFFIVKDAANKVLTGDVCVWQLNNNSYEVVASNMTTNKFDLVSVLAHEFGHITAGLDHSPGTTMQAGVLRGTIARQLFTDDIDGARSKYSSHALVELGSYWRQYNFISDVWSSRTSIGGNSSFRQHRGDIGASSVTDYVVVAGVDDAVNKMTFKRATYPLYSGSSWTAHDYTTSSYVSAAVTSDHTGTSSEWLAAWPLSTDKVGDGCSSLQILRSFNSFTTASAYTLSDVCTHLAPALEYDSYNGFFVLIWVEYDYSTEENTLKMKYKTSSNPISAAHWSATRDLGRFTSDTPGLSCNDDGECLLTYVRASSDRPDVIAREVSFSSAGVISLGSWTAYGPFVQREPSVAWVGYFDEWLVGYHFPSSTDWESRGWGYHYSVADADNPPNDSLVYVGESAEVPAGIVGNDAFTIAYSVYAD